MTTMGLDDIQGKFAKLGRPMIKRIVDAGADAATERMKANARMRGHIRTGDMMNSIGPSEYFESMGGGAEYVYPQGDNREGQRTATIAYVINYGRGKTKTPRMGDRFITGDEKAAKAAVAAAMQAESDRILAEIGG